ncbi:hypothetical protein [Aestuariivivens sediminis]|uniref:hypothetical protein n=1 Tax=Aestuariivivens sediminis TaxID=2913557 RepID=UPI001F560443|nr:hypothetical protein [Aestuariivivens sediminis]
MKPLLFFVFIFNFYLVSGQMAFNTGSVQLDSDLNSINTQARKNSHAFETDIKLSYDISDRQLNYMSLDLHMAPGEIFLSLEISRIVKVSLDEVLSIYRTKKSKGWGVIAKQFGIRPGSQEFHQLKNIASSKSGRPKGNKHKNKGKG